MDIIEELILEDIEDYCNVTFDRNNLPAGVVLAIHRKLKQDDSYGITSEKIADMSKSYADPTLLEQHWTTSLEKYARPHLTGNKMKRPYRDGRRRR